MTGRASVFGDGDDLDLTEFTPKTAPDTTAPTAEKVRAVSETAKFTSREPKAAQATAPKREPRRYRTGRNVQFNMKVSQQTIDAFNAIREKKGWVQGEVLEKAVAALQRELKIST